MKKNKLSIGLVTSFIASMALSACGSKVTKDSTNLVNFTGYDDQELAVAIEDIYNDYMQSSSGIQKYYEQVMEVLIRHAFQKDKKGDDLLSGIKKSYNTIANDAKDDVRGAKETAKTNAETNGTNYKTEWKAILSEKGVKDEEELLQYFIYKREKEEIEDWYYEKHEDELRREYLGVWSSSKEGSEVPGTPSVSEKASSRFPYHIRHILVKNEEGGNDYARGTISSDAAKLLSNTVKLLAQGTMSFGEVAKQKSEDSSADSYGDVGIMTNVIEEEKLKMVNEFQLGIYAYDAIIKNEHEDEVTHEIVRNSPTIDEGLGLNKKINGTQTVEEYFKNDRGILEIPYSAFVELGDVAELENNFATGLTVEDGKSALFPRNLLWNRYFNNHSIFVITNGKREADYDPTGALSPAEARDIKQPSLGYYCEDESHMVDDYIKYDETEKKINYGELNGFVGQDIAYAKHADHERVLVDEKNNVIIGVRSEFGIHLMIVEKSAYDFNDAVKLEDYYTTSLPKDSDYPKDIPAGDHTYVDFIYSENSSEYNTRADAVKSAIKGFDKTYDYRLYEELRSAPGVDTQKNEKLFTLINGYIELQREKNIHDQEEGLEKVWKTYYDLLTTQDNYRSLTVNRIIPEGCKIAFTKDLTEAEQTAMKDKYEKGGACYVK